LTQIFTDSATLAAHPFPVIPTDVEESLTISVNLGW